MAEAGAGGTDAAEEKSRRRRRRGGMVLSWEAAVQSLNGIIQLHFEKTLEKKRAVDAQKQELWRLLVGFFVFLAVASVSWGGVVVGGGWRAGTSPLHKLTLALATDRLKHIKARYSLPNFGAGGAAAVMAGEIEIPYQEPPESYLGKFKRSWAMHFGFLMCTFGFMVSSAVVILCF
uniref:Uncharacterized protein n=1 Tax=Ananas comosus var. bracteatus TaxID=296719 RepID=A0A6V7Q6U2_ANACO|nr:unnamed protein product [Ananas comosus var. bracteatus]